MRNELCAICKTVNLLVKTSTYWYCTETKKIEILYPNPMPNTMNLMMFIGNDLIESIPLDNERISKPGYVGNFKRFLKLKYNELIQKFPERPEFLIIDPNPKANIISIDNNHNPGK